MKTATCTLEMNTARAHQNRAFTIMELLMVIAIMAIVAGLIVGLAGVTGDNKKIKRTEAELAKLVTLIEEYKNKVGVYPPDNPNGNFPERNTLLYELAGCVRIPVPDTDPLYTNAYASVRASILLGTFSRGGVVNAQDEGNVDPDANRMHPVLKDLKSDQFAEVFPGTRSLVVPVDGLNGRLNPWNYRLGNPTNAHNPQSFDLWVEIKLGTTNGVPKTKIIGNWKN
jgi:prepilin-type N-terminal cleavage/methylation domain-containing protein